MGVYFEPPDENGRLWVHLVNLGGLRLPVIMPDDGGAVKTLRVCRQVLVDSPTVASVDVEIAEEDYQDAVG